MSDRLQGKLLARLQKLHDAATSIRGVFLEQAIWIETLVTDIIVRHFTSDERQYSILNSLIFNRAEVTFNMKIEVLQKLFKFCYKDLLKKYSGLFPRLHKIRRRRNRLAHSHLDTSEEFLSKGFKDRIQLIFYENGRTKQEVITLKNHHAMLQECSRIVHILTKLQDEVAKRNDT
jgi:hypothetical protein